MKKSKYRNTKTLLDGITFDSKREAYRYFELKILQKAGEIEGLKLQVPFELVPKNDRHRAVTYKADFVYRDKDGRQVVEDAKGVRTKEYLLKRKLLYHVHGIDISEV